MMRSRLFEGVLRHGSLQLMLHIDYTTGTLFLRAARDGRWFDGVRQFRATEMLRRLPPLNDGQRQLIGYGFTLTQRIHDAAFGSYIDRLAPDNDNAFLLETPGVHLIRASPGWSKSAFPPVVDAVIDFSGADFSGAHFSEMDFHQAIVTGVRFSGARFHACVFGRDQLVGARLDGARLGGQLATGFDQLDLSGADLGGAELTSAIITGSNLTGANLRDVHLMGTGAWFTNCDLTGAHFDDAEGTDLRFIRCNLTDATFDHARVDGWQFPGSTLRRTSFRSTHLTNARFTRIPELSLPPPVLDAVDIESADLGGADFSDQDLVGKMRWGRGVRFGRTAAQHTKLVRAAFELTFLGRNCAHVDATDAKIVYDVDPDDGIRDFDASHAILPQIQFAGFRLRRANFSGATLTSANFNNADLYRIDFTGAELGWAEFTAAALEGADFTQAVLTSANFTSAWMLQATFDRTVLRDTNFSSAMLLGVSFSGFDGASLAGANFSNAFLAQTDFKSVRFTSSDTQRTSFAEACLAGAEFTGALLGDAVLTNAYVSTAIGWLTLSYPRQEPVRVDFDPTQLAPDATSLQTTCPDGRRGPCSVAQLHYRRIGNAWPPVVESDDAGEKPGTAST